MRRAAVPRTRVLPWVLPWLLAAGGCAPTLQGVRRAEDVRAADSGAVRRAARSPDPEMRISAMRAMGRIQSPAYETPLLAGLRDPEPGVRAEAAFALGQLRIDASSAAPAGLVAALEAALSDPDVGVKAAAAEALGKAGGRGAEERLGTLLAAPEPLLRREAAAGLFRLRFLKRVPDYSSATVRLLLGGLSDDDADVRWRSAYAFSRWPEPRAERALFEASLKPNEWERLFAVRALAQLEAPGADAAGRMFSAPAPGAATAPGAAEENGLAAARRALSDSSDAVRVEALDLLRAARRGDLVAPELAASPSVHVRAAAAAALEGPEGDWNLLASEANDPAPFVRGQAFASLAKRRGDAFKDGLLGALTDPSWWVRSRAAEAAQALPKEGFSILERALHDDDVRVREAALEAIGKRPGELAQAFIAQTLLDPRAPLELRGTAIDAVGERKELALLDPLRGAYRRSEGREYVEARESAADAAAALGEAFPADKEIVAFEAELLRDPAPSVRTEMARDLHRDPGPLPSPRPSPFLGVAPSTATTLVLETTKGEVVIELSTAAAPIHAASVAAFAARGGYDGTPWHRVVSNFVVQGGDPRGTGWGDAGYFLRDEINRTRFDRGVVGMPKAGKDTGGCQLFITLVPTPHLDGRYTAFGRVVSGMPVVDRLEPGDLIRRAYLK